MKYTNLFTILSLLICIFFIECTGKKDARIEEGNRIAAQHINSPFGILGAYQKSLRRPGETNDEGTQFYQAMGFQSDKEYFNYTNSLLQEAGFRWVRLDVWIVSDEKGYYPKNADENVYAMVEGGFNILATIFPGDEVTFAQSDWESYQEKVAYLMERFDGDGINDAPGSPRILYWQPGNEPNSRRNRLPGGGWSEGAKPLQYAEFFNKTAEVIKREIPDAKILLAGVYDAGGQLGEAQSPFIDYYEPVLRAINPEYIDMFDWHWYGNAFEDYIDIEVVIKQTRDLFEETGFPRDFAIWQTETGTATGQAFGTDRNQTEEEQARSLVKRYVFSLSLGIHKIFWAWGMVEGFHYQDHFFDRTGFVYDGLGPTDKGINKKKTAFYTMSRLSRHIEGLPFQNTIPIDDPSIKAYLFRSDIRDVIVVWSDVFDNENFQTEVSIPYELQGKQAVIQNSVTGEETVIASVEKSIKVQVGLDPLFISIK